MKRGLLEWKCWVKSFYNKCPTLQGPNGLKGLEQYSASHIWFWTFYILYNFDSLHTLSLCRLNILFSDTVMKIVIVVLQLFPFISLGFHIVKHFFSKWKDLSWKFNVTQPFTFWLEYHLVMQFCKTYIPLI